jgi:hypothetical protein
MEQLFAVAAKDGIWVLLFVFLFWYLLQTNKEDKNRYIAREDKYYAIIETLSNKLPEIMDDLKLIMNDLNIIKGKIKE